MELKSILKNKNKKGVAGLEIILSVVSMLFLIGIIVMIFALSGGKLYEAIDDNTSKAVINDTTNALDDVIDWFPTFIVLAAMVVLILLVVIIIRSIKGSGITEGA